MSMRETLQSLEGCLDRLESAPLDALFGNDVVMTTVTYNKKTGKYTVKADGKTEVCDNKRQVYVALKFLYD
jgi:hypothetical protein